jgi:hypothetical protein
MNVSTTPRATVEIRRGSLLGLVAATAVLAAVVTWALSSYAVDTHSGKAQTNRPRSASAHAALTAQPPPASQTREELIMSITPAALAAGALGGYALPSAKPGPTTAQILASMTPATRRYTKRIISLTFGQLKAGAAGWP